MDKIAKYRSCTDSYISNMIEEGEEDIAQGRTFSSNEAKLIAETWLKTHK